MSFRDHLCRPLNVVVLQHVPFEGPAAIESWFASRGHRVAINRRWFGEEVPDTAAVDVLVVMGGPMSANDADQYPWLEPEISAIGAAIDAGVPVLGVCLGAQLIARALGATVRRAAEKEIGWWPVEFDARGTAHEWSGFTTSLPARATVMHWHGETFDLPAGASRIASSPTCENQGFLFGSNVVALQFHLESTSTSVAELTRKSSGDIEYGTYQVAGSRANELMRAGELTYGGFSRAILSALLDHIEARALERR